MGVAFRPTGLLEGQLLVLRPDLLSLGCGDPEMGMRDQGPVGPRTG